jgi:ABC-type multidrug transport system ATPase subunit
MIHVEHLTKTFGRIRAVDDLSFDVQPGEALALWGANGAGKTTVLRCVLGLVRYRGRIEVAGGDVAQRGKNARRAIGYVPQELALPADLRVMETLRFFGHLKRCPRTRPAEVLTEVGLLPQARQRVGTLSGGMKQRLALGVALLSDPPLLVLDELTANLDVAAQSAFLTRLETQRARGKTVLFASHRLEEIEASADRVLVLEQGRKRLECPATGLAQAIGLRCLLRVRVAEASISRAVSLLEQRTYRVSRNGQGLLVEVPAGQKAAAIATLVEGKIPVRDFEVSSEVTSSPEHRP